MCFSPTSLKPFYHNLTQSFSLIIPSTSQSYCDICYNLTHVTTKCPLQAHTHKWRMPNRGMLKRAILIIGLPLERIVSHRTENCSKWIVRVADFWNQTRTPVSPNQDTKPLRPRNLACECQQTSTFDNRAQPKHRQFAAPALQTVRIQAENKPFELAATNQETLLCRKSYLFPAARTTLKTRLWRKIKAAIVLLKPLGFPAESTNIASTVKSNYKLCNAYRISVSAMPAVNLLFDTEVCKSLVCQSLILQKWTSHIKYKDVPQLRTAIKQQLFLDILLLLRPHRGNLSTNVWVGVAPHRAVHVLLETRSLVTLIAQSSLRSVTKFPGNHNSSL